MCTLFLCETTNALKHQCQSWDVTGHKLRSKQKQDHTRTSAYSSRSSTFWVLHSSLVSAFLPPEPISCRHTSHVSVCSRPRSTVLQNDKIQTKKLRHVSPTSTEHDPSLALTQFSALLKTGSCYNAELMKHSSVTVKFL